MADARFLAGATAIAKALGVSRKTVQRMIQDGRLPTFRTGGNTSPHRLEVKSLAAVRGERKG